MAVISTDTFRPFQRINEKLFHYVGVRLQQGVPIVDADWNELEDIRKFEVRAFLKWFVGDGVPHGNDGFRVEVTGLANDFWIRAGAPAAPPGTSPLDTGLRHTGRCLVDGLDVQIDKDIRFTSQPLHQSQPGAAAEQARLAPPNVPLISPLANPVADGTVLVYLDVWERRLTPQQQPSLVQPGLGTESCARVTREWVVRVRDGVNLPVPGNPDFNAGHSYYALASITRRNGDPNVVPGDVTDLRERTLLVPPSTLISDLFGVSPADYRRGKGRPAISVREAINALLRGEIPSTPDTAIFPATGLDAMRRGFLFDNTNGVVAMWSSNRVGRTDQIFAARLDQDNVAAGFIGPPQQITTGAFHNAPHAALLPNGDLITVYQTGVFSSSVSSLGDIHYRRAPFGGLSAAEEKTLAATEGVAETNPSVVVSGNMAVFFYHLGSTARWQYRRLRHTDNVMLDGAPVEIPAPAQTSGDLHAARDNAGNIWVAFTMQGSDIRALRLNPNTGAIDQEQTFSAAAFDTEPFILCAANGDVFVFWTAGGFRHARFTAGAWGAIQQVPNTSEAEIDQDPCVVEDANGGIWLFWARGLLQRDIFFMRRDPNTGTWSQPRQLTVATGIDTSPFALMAPNNALWVFWASNRAEVFSGDLDIFYKRLVTAL